MRLVATLAALLAALAAVACSGTPASAPEQAAAPPQRQALTLGAAVAHWKPIAVPKAAVSSSGDAEKAVDGDPESEWYPQRDPAPGEPQWLALPLSRPAARPLGVVWHSHGRHYQLYGYARPRDYRIEASGNSTDGRDGDWETVHSVTENAVRSRLDRIEAPGARWVRLVFTNASDTFQPEPFLREVGVYEAEGPGRADVWLFLGDSVTALAFDPASPDDFAKAVRERRPGAHPVAIGGGTGGDEAANIAARLEVALPTLPPGSVVALCYGANDATRGVPVAAYKTRLQAAIDRIRAAGHTPLLAVTPWNLNGKIAEYAEACRALARENALLPGPDFHAYFEAHPDELGVDRVHPTPAGVTAMQRLWAEAAAARYAAP